MKKSNSLKSLVLTIFLSVSALQMSAQNSENLSSSMNGGLTIGGYGQIDYNQPFGAGVRNNGELDVHRLVMMLGYRFDERTQFFSEIEFEHAHVVDVEQAFLQYKLNSNLQLKGGLVLVPMGMLNESHEPTAYNGVERPLVEKFVSPTTWREIGAGVSGICPRLSVKYQAYLMSGYASYNNGATIGGVNGLREGRQEGGEAFQSYPNFSGRIGYFGLRHLQLGLSGYLGKTQSSLYNNLDKNDSRAKAAADSSVVNVMMIGADASYSIGALQLKGQYYYTKLSNTNAFNKFTAIGGVANDLGSAMLGWYVEAGYNVLKYAKTTKELTPFVRIENYDINHKVESLIVKNNAYNTMAYTTGIGLKLNKNAVIKADLQFVKTKADSKFSNTLNVGVGMAF